jgi:hypothetical protein
MRRKVEIEVEIEIEVKVEAEFKTCNLQMVNNLYLYKVYLASIPEFNKFTLTIT